MKKRRILITGGSGMIGARLTDVLLKRNYEVVHLGRSISRYKKVEQFVWDVDKGLMEHGALQGVDAIVHLAGANLADGRWTAKRKKLIVDSRVKSSRLLFEHLAREKHQVTRMVSASGIGYYGFSKAHQEFSESDGPGADFLSHVVKEWEEEVDHVGSLGISLTKLRLGVVLSPDGGALTRIVRTVRNNIGAVLGTGQQVMSWVHLDDVCAAFLFSLEHETEGPYNVAAPQPVTNEGLTMAVAEMLQKRIRLPHVPSWVLYLIFGEIAAYALTSTQASSQKLQGTGFHFQFPGIEGALADLLQIPGTS